MAQLPDDFALSLSPEGRQALLKGLVLRQQLMRLAMKGLNATRASSLVGCGKDTARAIYRDPEFRKEVLGRVDGAFADVDLAFVETRKGIHERLAEKAEKAFDVLCDMLDSEETMPSIRMKVAHDILDRNPETQAGHTVTRLNPALASESLQQAARIAREMDEKVMPIRRRA